MNRRTLVFAAPLLVLGCTLGCDEETSHEKEATSESTPGDEQVDPQFTAGAEKMDESDASTLTITAAESDEHGLPKAAITLHLGDTFMRTAKFPGDGIYVSMSGPPGAPLGLIIQLLHETFGNEAGWRRFIEKSYQDESANFGTAADVEMCGANRPACTFTTGNGNARTHHLAVSVNIPESDQSVVVHFWSAAGKNETPIPNEMVGGGRYAELLQSVAIEFE
ncbi:hypothetical protein OAS39_06595 [Pirellulales bacterium]|nr:hypothetical protein [Pirellulales bacterium]